MPSVQHSGAALATIATSPMTHLDPLNPEHPVGALSPARAKLGVSLLALLPVDPREPVGPRLPRGARVALGAVVAGLAYTYSHMRAQSMGCTVTVHYTLYICMYFTHITLSAMKRNLYTLNFTYM